MSEEVSERGWHSMAQAEKVFMKKVLVEKSGAVGCREREEDTEW